MRIAMAPRLAATEHGFLRTRRAAARGIVIIGAIATCGLAGCSSEIIDPQYAQRLSRERTTLLKRQAAPSCEYRTASLNKAAKRTSEPWPVAGDASSDADILRAKLDYERQCYKHAEMIARARLTSLQATLDKAIKRYEASAVR